MVGEDLIALVSREDKLGERFYGMCLDFNEIEKESIDNRAM